MPKCEADQALLHQIQLFIGSNGLTVSGAAVRLGVERTTFWRFCSTGRAREDTRALYREALLKCNKNGVGSAVNDAFEAGMLAAHAHFASQGAFTDCELQLVRKACRSVLALLDIYEANRSAKSFEYFKPKANEKGGEYVRG